MLTRRDWLVLFVGAPRGKFFTDQIRTMKGMFLFSQEGPPGVRGLYDFQPYAYGPFDTQIYHDLDALEAEGIVRSDRVAGTNRLSYRLTDSGEALAQQLEDGAHGAALQTLRRIKLHVTSLSFLELLEDVYERYPAYAIRSVARR